MFDVEGYRIEGQSLWSQPVSTFNSVSGIGLGFQVHSERFNLEPSHGFPFYFKVMFCAFSGLFWIYLILV